MAALEKLGAFALTAPTLVLAGDDDPIVPLVNARILARRIPRAGLQVIHGGGHLFILERPAATADLVAGFLHPRGGRHGMTFAGRCAVENGPAACWKAACRFWPIMTNVDRKIASSDTINVDVGHGEDSTNSIQAANTTTWLYTNGMEPANAVIRSRR